MNHHWRSSEHCEALVVIEGETEAKMEAAEKVRMCLGPLTVAETLLEASSTESRVEVHQAALRVDHLAQTPCRWAPLLDNLGTEVTGKVGRYFSH